MTRQIAAKSATRARLVFIALMAVVAAGLMLASPDLAWAQNATNVEGHTDQSQFWRAVREGERGTVAFPNAQAGQLIQSEGENWRAIRNGPVSFYGAQVLIGMIALLGIFFLLRGRVAIDRGRDGRTVTRFNGVERFGHWLLAVSFIILGLTGLNLLYGRYILLPVMGEDAFAFISAWGKYLHNYVAFAFMAGLVLVFVMWIKDNFPSRSDVRWIMEGGGIIGTTHPPAKRFNFGQKVIFWSVLLCGASISLSGIALMFPFQTAMFAKTFAFLNSLGWQLNADLTPLEEMQYAQIWHNVVALFLIAVVLAHIYIGSIGMEGAFDAMGSGEVDVNWAKEHHALWVDKLEAKGVLAAEKPPTDSEHKPQAAE